MDAMDLTKYPAQNVSLLVRDVKEDLWEIYMNVDSNQPVPGLVKKALSGLAKCTDPLIQMQVRQLCLESNQAGFGQAASAVSPFDALDKVENMYLTLRDQDDYGPAKEIKAQQAVAAFQANVTQAVQQHLQQDRSAWSSVGGGRVLNQRACWDCGATTHLCGDSNCPNSASHTPSQQSMRPSPSSAPAPAPAHTPGVADPNQARVNQAACDFLNSLKPLSSVSPEQKIDFIFEGQLLGKICTKCG